MVVLRLNSINRRGQERLVVKMKVVCDWLCSVKSSISSLHVY